MPGEDYSYAIKKFPGRVYNSIMPIQMSKDMIIDTRSYMTPDQWYVYCGLMWYEWVKFEQSTPTLDEIYEESFSSNMTKERFLEVIEELQNLYFQDKNGALYPVLRWERGESYEENCAKKGKR